MVLGERKRERQSNATQTITTTAGMEEESDIETQTKTARKVRIVRCGNEIEPKFDRYVGRHYSPMEK